MTRAVVLGGGMAGQLAAAALAEHVDEVTVVESDRYPDSVGPRRGIPQAYQNHMLMGGGAQAVEQILPGMLAELYAAGAHRRRLGQQILTLSGQGWFRRFPSESFVLAASRHLIDHMIRRRALALPGITLCPATKAVGLVGTAQRVIGVRVEDGDGERRIPADLVVDATGSRSKSPEWLRELGLAGPREDFLDPDLAYAGRWYTAPADVHPEFPGVLIQTASGTGQPGRGGALMPNEGGRWMVALLGTKGASPPNTEEGFIEYARTLRHPVLAELLDRAEPIGPIRSAHAMANRRRYFEKLPVPDGFVALGDAVAVLSPNYATGMSVAAQGALALRGRLAAHGLRPGLAARVQAAVAKVVAPQWQMVVANDSGFPGVESNLNLAPFDRMRGFTARVTRTALENQQLASVTYRMSELTGSTKEMMAPSLLWSVLRGPRAEQLSAEQAIAQFPEFGRLLDPIAAD